MRMLFLPFFLVLMVALPVSVRAGELDRAMGLCGISSIAQIDASDLVARPSSPP